MKNIFFKTAKSNLLKAAATGFLLLCLSVTFAFEANAGWKFWEKKEICEKLVEPIVNKSIRSLILSIKGKEDIDHKTKEMDRVKNECYQSILKTGDYKELYAYYLFYKYADDALKVANKGNDNAPNNIYHYMLFYANQNSRDFDQKTNSFKKEHGLYEKELKDFEDKMTQEEKIKSFSYIADNLATGTEGWVKKHDYRKSFEYLKRAAEAGDYSSQNALGIRYFLGSDRYNKFTFEKNYVEGYKWIYLSTIHSTQDDYYRKLSLKSFSILKKKMILYQIHDAEQQAKIWLGENKEFIKNHPLKIIIATQEEIKSEQEKTQKFIKDYGLDKSLSNSTNHYINQ